jgi:hypothetical protein
VRPGLLVDAPCSAPAGPGVTAGVTPVVAEEGAGVVPVLGAVVAGGRNGVSEVPGRDGGENVEGPAAADRRSRVGRGVLSPDRDVGGRPGVDGPSVADAAALRWCSG